MSLWPLVGIAGSTALVAGWLAAAAASRGDARLVVSPGDPNPPPIDPLVEQVRNQSDGLAERLRYGPRPINPPRNPFEYDAPRESRVVPVSSAPEPAPADPPDPVPTRPALRLIGIAEDPGDEGPVRSAILSGQGDLFIVREGERVGPLEVIAVGADSVQLRDPIDQTTFILTLR